ncbi:hypothetical protein, partial [Streptomyces werraensis]|uniref:hypothetical protein n=1 Tax=Streptomyces werraensis TaxID=68284 RepID=UPI0033B15B7F
FALAQEAMENLDVREIAHALRGDAPDHTGRFRRQASLRSTEGHLPVSAGHRRSRIETHLQHPVPHVPPRRAVTVTEAASTDTGGTQG